MDFKKTTIEDLQKFVHEKRDELRDLRFSVAGSKNRNVKHVRTIRKDVARALTQVTALRATQQ